MLLKYLKIKLELKILKKYAETFLFNCQDKNIIKSGKNERQIYKTENYHAVNHLAT